jgi:hypothetical protein
MVRGQVGHGTGRGVSLPLEGGARVTSQTVFPDGLFRLNLGVEQLCSANNFAGAKLGIVLPSPAPCTSQEADTDSRRFYIAPDLQSMRIAAP